jgi:hypothetical protein
MASSMLPAFLTTARCCSRLPKALPAFWRPRFKEPLLSKKHCAANRCGALLSSRPSARSWARLAKSTTPPPTHSSMPLPKAARDPSPSLTGDSGTTLVWAGVRVPPTRGSSNSCSKPPTRSSTPVNSLRPAAGSSPSTSSRMAKPSSLEPATSRWSQAPSQARPAPPLLKFAPRSSSRPPCSPPLSLARSAYNFAAKRILANRRAFGTSLSSPVLSPHPPKRGPRKPGSSTLRA